MLVAMNIEDMLLELGHEVAGLAGRLQPGLLLVQEAVFDVAMLDVNLAGEQSFLIADALAEKGIPYIFATGYGLSGVVDAHRHAPILQKPFRARDLELALQALAPR